MKKILIIIFSIFLATMFAVMLIRLNILVLEWNSYDIAKPGIFSVTTCNFRGFAIRTETRTMPLITISKKCMPI